MLLTAAFSIMVWLGLLRQRCEARTMPVKFAIQACMVPFTSLLAVAMLSMLPVLVVIAALLDITENAATGFVRRRQKRAEA